MFYELKFFVRVVFVSLLMSVGTVYAASPEKNLHLLLISNGHYVAGKDVSGAHLSSMVFRAELAKRFKVSSARLLRSDDTRLVSRQDIFDAVASYKTSLSKDKDFLLVYYIGHGYGEGIAWNYFLQPGNFPLPPVFNEFDVLSLAESMVYVGDLNEALQNLDVPFSVMIDACYEGESVDLTMPVLSPAAQKSISDTQAILRVMNEFRTPNPVVFSAPPGDTVSTAGHPTNKSYKLNIGPLARRTALAFESEISTLNDFINALMRSDLEAHTRPAISNHQLQKAITFPPNNHPDKPLGPIEVTYGTASKTEAVVVPIVATDQEEEGAINVISATASFIGADGEYISDGKDQVFTHGIDVFSVSTLSAGELELVVDEEGESWTFSFAAPDGESFSKQKYSNVSRYPFHEGKQAGISISGDGRACNNISGYFEVDEVKFVEGNFVFLSLSFEQLCDDDLSPMRGMVILEVKH